MPDLPRHNGADARESFVRLLGENQSRLFGFLYAHVLNMADAEDLYQQVAMLLWSKFDQFEPGTDFGAWGLRVADFTIKNFLRGKRRSKVCFSEEAMQRLADQIAATPLQRLSRRADALRGCLKKLRSEDQSLIQRCYESDLPIKDIAERDGRSAGALYTSLTRIRRILLACIDRTLRAEGVL